MTNTLEASDHTSIQRRIAQHFKSSTKFVDNLHSFLRVSIALKTAAIKAKKPLC
ncbi:MAG: hypothetical protein ACI9ES_000690 [Oceanospirillaceae bacterium]|jgi:hypothetical protein